MSSAPSGVEEIKALRELLKLERSHAQKEHENLLSQSSLQERLEKGLSWQPLEITDQGYGLGDYPYLVVQRHRHTEFPHAFSPGKSAELYAIDGTTEETLTGIVQFAENDQLKVTFFVDDLPDWIEKERLGIHVGFDERTFSEMDKALVSVIDSDNEHTIRQRMIFAGHTLPSPPEDHHPLKLPELNTSQNTALNAALHCQELAGIHGPPGTGKTTTLVQLIAQVAKKENRVLVCAPSNAAVDLLTKKCSEQGLKVLRVGNLARMDEEVLMHTLEHRVSQHTQFKEIKKAKRQAQELRKMAGKYKRNFGREEREQRRLLYREAKEVAKDALKWEDHITSEIVQNVQVVTTTLVGAANRILENQLFKTVIIDEAAQALEPATWIPMLKAERAILGGDPFQLPPTVKNNDAKAKGLEVTLLEKLVQQQKEVYLLDTQYRMHEHIMAFSNSEFYGGYLKAHTTIAQQTLEANEPPMEFIDTSGCSFEEHQQGQSGSYGNKGEVDVLLKHLAQLRSSHSEVSIGIITPYREQVLCIDGALKENELANIPCHTVDGFQGQEKDVIYISMVRCNDDHQLGFLKDYRRMNVALTRARKKLVVIGDSATLGADPFYQRFLQFIEDHGFYRTAWEFLY